MEKPITASFRWSIEEMLLLNRIHMRCSAKFRKVTKNMRRMGFLFVFMSVLFLSAIGIVPNPSDRPRMLVIGICFVLVACGFLFGFPAIMRRAVVKSYAQKPDRDMVITYELSDEGLSCRSEVASSSLRWDGIRGAVRTGDGFLLYIADTLIHWLPIRSFQNKDDIERFAQLAKARVPRYEEER